MLCSQDAGVAVKSWHIVLKNNQDAGVAVKSWHIVLKNSQDAGVAVKTFHIVLKNNKQLNAASHVLQYKLWPINKKFLFCFHLGKQLPVVLTHFTFGQSHECQSSLKSHIDRTETFCTLFSHCKHIRSSVTHVSQLK